SSFNIIAGTATQLVFGTQPGTTVAGQQITPAGKVRELDALGNVATGFTGAVTVALGNNPGGSTLSGTLLVAAGGGVESFGDLSPEEQTTEFQSRADGVCRLLLAITAFAITLCTTTCLAS